jgi:hypothetical protein
MSTPTELWIATPEDVAAILRARTRDDAGNELGAWTTATRPTLDEVERLIALATSQITDADGPGERCTRLCRAAITYQTACLIELSYFPEQVRSDRSPYSELKELLEASLEAFDTCVKGGDVDGQGGGEGYGYHSLPTAPLTTWRYYGDGGQDAPGWRHPERAATWQRALLPPTPAEPALVDEPEPPPEPLTDVVIGHPGDDITVRNPDADPL